MPKNYQRHYNPSTESSNRAVVSRSKCTKCEKFLYTSKHDARMALTGQLRSKSIRVYPCPEKHGNYHVTKEQIKHLR